jgi:hypothetical protein
LQFGHSFRIRKPRGAAGLSEIASKSHAGLVRRDLLKGSIGVSGSKIWGPVTEWKYQKPVLTMKELKRKVHSEKREGWPPGKRSDASSRNAAIHDKLVGPVFGFEMGCRPERRPLKTTIAFASRA